MQRFHRRRDIVAVGPAAPPDIQPPMKPLPKRKTRAQLAADRLAMAALLKARREALLSPPAPAEPVVEAAKAPVVNKKGGSRRKGA